MKGDAATGLGFEGYPCSATQAQSTYVMGVRLRHV
jgi:hypothetical protein